MNRPSNTEIKPAEREPGHSRVAGVRILVNMAEDMCAPSARPVWRLVRTVFLDQLERPSRPITVGRAPICDLVIEHPTVSARHCRIERLRGDVYTIEDCGSANGVYLAANGPREPRRVEWAKLALGCYVYLGDVALVPVDKNGRAALAGDDLSEYVRNARAVYGSQSQVGRHLGLTGTLLQRLALFWRTVTRAANDQEPRERRSSA